MSEESWIELSQMLVDTSPGIKYRLLNTLQGISFYDKQLWIERYDRKNNPYGDQPHRNTVPAHKSFVHRPTNQGRFYKGRPNTNLTVKFVDNEGDFEWILDFLKVRSE